MIPKNVLFLFVVFIVNLSFSQETYKVEGRLVSQSEAIPFATVLLKTESDSTIFKAAFSDSLGNFILPGISNGNYFIEASMVGLSPYISEVFRIENGHYNIGEIEMIPNNELGTVNVTKLRPVIEIRPDKTVFNVDNTINATGSNGFDLLRKAPGVIIDNNNNIILEGKSGVMVYIDNKQTILSGDDLISFLKALQASDIDQIEIITQPSSKYDAAGNAGIINIILKRDKRLGTNGNLTAGYAYGVNHRMNSSLMLNHRNKKSNIYATYSNNLGKRWNYFDFDRTQFGVLYDSYTESISLINAHNARVGADWFIKPRHTIGVLATGNFFDTDSETSSTTRIIPVSASTADQILTADNSSVGQSYQMAGNLNYRFADTSGHEFSIDADYGIYNREANSYQPNLYIDGATSVIQYENNYRMITPTNIQIITGKADYNQNLFGGVFGVGAKYSLVKTDNTFDFYDVVSDADVLNIDRSNQFNYSENINAVYLNFARKLKTKWNMQLGLRLEQTISEGILISTQSSAEDTVKRNYLNVFPSGGLTFTPNFNHIWSLTFSRRIHRPNYMSLNPFETQISELSFIKGNPFLQPQYASNVKIAHTFKYRFTTSLSVSYVEDFFAQVTDTIGLTKSFMTSRNVANERTISLGLSLPFEIKPWWNVYISLNGFHNAYIGTDDKFEAVDRFTFSAYAMNSFLLPGGLKFEVSGWFSSPSIWGGTYLTQSMGSLDLALEKKIMKDRLSIRLAASDILYTSPWSANMEYGDLVIYGSGGWESRVVRFTLAYNFGNSEVKGSRKRKTGLEDEEKRTAGQ